MICVMARVTAVILFFICVADASSTLMGPCASGSACPSDHTFMLQLKSKGEVLSAQEAADAQELALARQLAHADLKADKRIPRDMFQTPEQAFAAIDQNHDGKITALDLLRLQFKLDALKLTHRRGTAVDSFTPAEARAEIRRVDANNDSVVDLAEFAADANATIAEGAAKEGVRGQRLARKLADLAAEGAARRGRRQANLSAQYKRRALVQLSARQGTVSELFTYGAPGTAYPQLRNGASHNGCFPGLRVYNEDRTPGYFWGYYMKSDPVSFISNVMGYAHARMDAVSLCAWNAGTPVHFKCGDESQWSPSSDPWVWFDGHDIWKYRELAMAQDSFSTLPVFIRMMMNIYNLEVPNGQPAQDTAWRMIAHAECSDSWGTTDGIELYQESGNQACLLVFQGSEKNGLEAISDWITNLRGWATSFCGFADVHQGWAAELQRIVTCPDFISRIKSKLPHCSEVGAAGHSMGGSLAELFTACANSDQLHAGAQRETSEWQHITWSKGEPELFPPAED
mmetsp:Transcript_9110/g.25478  ORF Transcript_9110/g.25478 Transcript_9110/m.25478 type:complete len:514 (-) Transcript_9110:223-1764(-)